MPKTSKAKARNLEPDPSEIPAKLTLNFRGDRLVRNLLALCIFVEISLVLIDALINYGRLIDIGAMRRLCNIAREDGLASWFQATQTLLAGLTLWAIFLINKARQKPGRTTLSWAVLAAFFTFMSADDGAQIHERLGSTAKALFQADPSSQDPVTGLSRLIEVFPSYTWQLFVLPVFIGLGLFMVFFIWHQESRAAARTYLLLAVSCFALAVGLDFFEGLDPEHRFNLLTWIQNRYAATEYTVWHFAKALEEFLEMLGISLLWCLFTAHLGRLIGNGLSLQVGDRGT